MTAASPQMIAGRYRVLRELGRGGMGVVYLVEHLGTGDHLALKLLLESAGASAEIVERFKREARAPARIKSEHVVRVTDTDIAPELGGAPFMVMELLNGRDLEKMVEEGRRFAPSEVVELLRQAATALDKAHALGITHRDLKPENMFLHRLESGAEVLKILDFGISKLKGDGNDIASAALTRTGAMMGTPLFMSPEQARGSADVGPATDIWALGLIAFRLLTGDVYWTAESLGMLMVQVLSEPMAPPSRRHPELPPAFDAWFARSTDRDPTKRFSSAGEQVITLAAAFGITLTRLSASSSGASMAVSAIGASRIAPAQAMPGNVTSTNLASSRMGETAAGLPRSRAPLFAMIGGVAVVAVVVGVLATRTSTQPSSAAQPEAEEKVLVKKAAPKPIAPVEADESPAPFPEPPAAAPTSTAKPAKSAASAIPSASTAPPVGTVVAKVEPAPAPVAAPPPPPKPVTAPEPPPLPAAKPQKYDPSAP